MTVVRPLEQVLVRVRSYERRSVVRGATDVYGSNFLSKRVFSPIRKHRKRHSYYPKC